MTAGVHVGPQWEVPTGSRRHRLDLAVPDCQVGIGCDGTAVHAEPRALYADRHRANDLLGAGWVVLRFTWWDVHSRPDWVVATVAAAVASRQT